MTPEQLRTLAHRALADLLAGNTTRMTYHAASKPAGWPFPAVRHAPDAAGNITNEYRPIVVLEWVADQLHKPAPAPTLPALSPLAPLPPLVPIPALPPLKP